MACVVGTHFTYASYLSSVIPSSLEYLELIANFWIRIDDVSHPVEQLDDQLGHVVAWCSLITKVVFRWQFFWRNVYFCFISLCTYLSSHHDGSWHEGSLGIFFDPTKARKIKLKDC